VFHLGLGLEIGGDIHVYMGPSGYGFAIAPALGIHLPVHRAVLLGARLAPGFYKGATGAQRASFFLRAAFLVEILPHERVFLRLELPALTMIAGGDRQEPVVGFLEMDLGLGVRF
jgi:hypothetical protein